MTFADYLADHHHTPLLPGLPALVAHDSALVSRIWEFVNDPTHWYQIPVELWDSIESAHYPTPGGNLSSMHVACDGSYLHATKQAGAAVAWCTGGLKHTLNIHIEKNLSSQRAELVAITHTLKLLRFESNVTIHCDCLNIVTFLQNHMEGEITRADWHRQTHRASLRNI